MNRPDRARPLGQNRAKLVVIEDVSLAAIWDPFLSLPALSAYSGLGVRTLRAYLSDAVHPLPHYRIGGRVLVKRGDYDAWAVCFRQVGRADVAAIVDNVLRDLRQPS